MAKKHTQDEPEMAFHTADTSRIFHAVQAIKKELGLTQGSVVAHANPYAAYDLYALLETYILNPEARLKIHEVIEQARKQTFEKLES